MANKLYEEKHIQDIANAIRVKTGKTDSLLVSAMAEEIEGITTKSDPILQDKTVTENGEYSADEGYDGLGKVTVEVIEDLSEIEDLIGDCELVEPGEGSGGGSVGASLNIHYGDTEPADTSMLWCKCDEPSNVVIKPDIIGENFIEYNVGNLTSKQYGMGVVTVGDVIYLFGGRVNGSTSSSIRKYDIKTGQITTLDVTLSWVTSCAKAIRYGNKIYVINLYASNSAFNIFDIETETITTSTMKGEYEQGAYARVGSMIYQFGCFLNSNRYNSIFSYNLETNEKIKLSVGMPISYGYASAESVGNKIYIFGGYLQNYINNIYIFDTVNQTVTQSSTYLPTSSRFLGTSVMGTDIYIFGGQGSTNLNTIFVYDTITDTIRTLDTTLQFKSYSIGVALHGTEFYLLGGYEYSNIDKYVIKPLLSDGSVQIQSTIKENMFELIKGETTLKTGVGGVYIGNSEGYGEKVDAYLYQNDAWVQI